MTLLRKALFLDAIGSGAVGAALLLGASFLDELLGLSVELMRGAGAFLLVYVACVVVVALRPTTPRAGAWAIVAANAAWSVASLMFVAGALSAVSLTTLGSAFVVAQALAVAGFGVLQVAGLRMQAQR